VFIEDDPTLFNKSTYIQQLTEVIDLDHEARLPIVEEVV